MKILFINLFYYPNMVGGTEHSLQLLAENLFKHGHEITIISFDGYKYQSDQINGVNVHRINNEIFYKKAMHDTNIKKTDKLLYYCGKYFNKKIEIEIEDILNDFKPDIVHTNNFFPARIWRIAEKKGCKTVHTIRDYYIIDPRSIIQAKNRYLNLWHRSYEKHYSNYVDAVTAPSQYVLDVHEKYGFFGSSLKQCVPNAIEINIEAMNNCIYKKMMRTDCVIEFLYVGALTENKGIKFLLETFHKYINQNVRLSICGDGPLRSYVESFALNNDRVKFHGKLDEENLNIEYMKADILIVPSLWPEPFGRIIIEGAYFGLPSIATARGGIPEIINELNAGDCFEPNSYESLIALLRRYSNRNYIKEQLNSLRENVKKYDVENQINQFAQLYRKLLGKGKK